MRKLRRRFRTFSLRTALLVMLPEAVFIFTIELNAPQKLSFARVAMKTEAIHWKEFLFRLLLIFCRPSPPTKVGQMNFTFVEKRLELFLVPF
jgi:hypothetical protein